MSNLIVMIFDNVEDAQKLRADLRSLEREGLVSLDDAAVIEKDAEGKVHVRNEVDTGVKVGALAGGLLGLFLSFMFPIAGLVVGAGGGALVGALMDKGVDRNFVNDVTESLKPGSSALFVIVRDAESDAVLGAIRPYQGTLYQTTLPTTLQEQLQDALK
jgi:uncharacterized membrane protein